jgi:F420-0:gamma-glutamyl ligase
MNEKLEQEIERYIKEKHLVPEAFLIPSIAQHFYNLALEDVRKEVEKIGEATIASIITDSPANDFNEGVTSTCVAICYFIDQQNK